MRGVHNDDAIFLEVRRLAKRRRSSAADIGCNVFSRQNFPSLALADGIIPIGCVENFDEFHCLRQESFVELEQFIDAREEFQLSVVRAHVMTYHQRINRKGIRKLRRVNFTD